MAINTVTIVFRLLAILAGVLIGIFAFQIYTLSKGGLKGWKYIAIYGGFLCFWAVSALITKLIGVTVLERITGIIGLLGMAVFVPYSYAKMTDELNLKPSWFTAKISLGSTAAVFLLLLVLNVFKPTFLEYPLDKLLSISHFTLAITLVFALIPLYVLSKNIKKSSWILATIATVVIFSSLMIGQHYDGCCAKEGELEDNDSLCGDYDLPYVQVTDAPCFEPIVNFGKMYQAYLTVGVLLLAGSFYQLSRGFKQITN
ncbi:MAG: hypothetical protein ACOCQX_00430 [Candidatus Nanoarchaeia archaeon]